MTFDELNSKVDRSFVLFGSGNIAQKTLRTIDESRVEFIADNSENLQGQKFKGIPIRDPESITSEHFVIITSTALDEISAQLQSMGLEVQSDFAVSPVLNDRIAISNLERLETEFYFTSGTITGDDDYGKQGLSREEGGLYKCHVDGLDFDYKQIYNGPCYGSLRDDSRLLFIDTDRGLMEYDETSGEINCLTDLPDKSRAHGVAISSKRSEYYIACSYRDSVLVYNSDYELKYEMLISDKASGGNEHHHHCNDVMVDGNRLYLTMFSSSGNWKRDRFDGCIAEFSLENGSRGRDLHQDLWMPHNIDIFNGSIHVLDSLAGELRFNNLTVQGEFPAFSRGLDYDDGLYFIGQSKNRNHSKLLGLSNNVSIDCGIIVFNPELKISRFLQFPKMGGIHSITF